MKRFNFFLIFSILVFLNPAELAAQAASNATMSGTTWLVSAQYGKGVWAFTAPPNPLQTEFTADDFASTYVRDTLQAVIALQTVEAAATEYQFALDWVQFFILSSTEQLSQKTQILSKAGRDATQPINILLAYRNLGGGFGGGKGYPSNVLDTAFALQGLASAHSTDTNTIDLFF